MNDQKKRNWFAKHKILTVVGGLVLLVIIGTSLSKGGNTTVNTTAASNAYSSSSSISNKAAATQAHVGSTVNVGGSKGLAVTVQQIVDPATAANQYTTADAGKRFVAVRLEIKNSGSSSYQDNANNGVTLIGSDNQSYTADFSNVSECTNFNSGQYTLAAGENATGCVVFQVPDAIKPAKVQFQTQSGFSGSTGEWLIP